MFSNDLLTERGISLATGALWVEGDAVVGRQVEVELTRLFP